MALVNCPECQQKVSDKAVQCPHCGFRLSPAAGSAPAQAVPVAEPAAQPVASTQPAADRSGSVTPSAADRSDSVIPSAADRNSSVISPSAADQKTKSVEASAKAPMDNKKKLMIGAAVAAVLLIGYFVFFSGNNTQTPAPSLPSAQPAGDQTPGTQGGTDGYTPFGTTTPLDANYSLFTSNRFGFTCYVPINDYVTEDEEYNIYVSTDVQAGIPYTMVSRYDYTDAPGVLEAVMNNLQQAYGNAGYTVGAQTQTGSVTDYNTNTSRTVYYAMCYYNVQGYTICDWRYAFNVGQHVYVVTTKDVNAQTAETQSTANLIMQTVKEN